MRIINNTLYRWLVVLAALFLLQLLPTDSRAQETSGALTGRVLDGAKAAVPDASIEAVHTPSGTKYTLSADKDGRFTINNMRIGGPYRVSATAVGLQSDVRNDIFIRLGGAQELELQLLAATQQIGEVLVSAPTLSGRGRIFRPDRSVICRRYRVRLRMSHG